MLISRCQPEKNAAQRLSLLFRREPGSAVWALAHQEKLSAQLLVAINVVEDGQRVEFSQVFSKSWYMVIHDLRICAVINNLYLPSWEHVSNPGCMQEICNISALLIHFTLSIHDIIVVLTLACSYIWNDPW